MGGLWLVSEAGLWSRGIGESEVGRSHGRGLVDTRGGGSGDWTAGDGWRNAAGVLKTGVSGGVCGAEAEEGGRGSTVETDSGTAVSNRGADGVHDDVEMAVEEGEERPKHDWSRTADW